MKLPENFSKCRKPLGLVKLQYCRLRVVIHFSLRIVERAKRERAWKPPHARKGFIFLSPRRVSPFLAWGVKCWSAFEQLRPVEYLLRQ